MARTRVQYTCPMHPEVVQDEPGSCPICGMALEPVTVTLEAERSPELIDMTRRFWAGVVLTLPLVVLTMGGMIPAVEGLLPAGWSSWIELVLATPVGLFLAIGHATRAIGPLQAMTIPWFLAMLAVRRRLGAAAQTD